MTGRTHDLAAFSLLNWIFVTNPIREMSLATGVVVMGANFIGGLAPDLDETTAGLWSKLPAGSIVGRIMSPLLGAHRLISHSLLGLVLAGWGVNYLLSAISNVLIVDMSLVWWSFMIGFFSHLLVDSLTRDGVPWLFPIPLRIGFPPFRFMRMKTSGILEKSFIFPGLLLFNWWLVYHNHTKYLDFFQHHIK